MVASRGEEIVEAATVALARLDALTRKPHSRRELCGVIDNLAARMEEFLRTAAFPASSRRDGLKMLISDLSSLGLDQRSISALQALRDLYNESKHDPAALLRLSDVRTAVANTVEAFRNVVDLEVAGINAPPDSPLSHHLWLAAWDHLMRGETEVAILLPSAHWTHVATFDNFHLDWKSWEALKSALSAYSNFKWGEENFPSDAWSTFMRDGDFLNAGVWDGDYGALLRVVARFHDADKMSEVLPGLQRGYNSISIGAAIATAAVDVARTSADALDSVQFAQLVVSRAATEYALCCDAAHPAVVQISELVSRQPHLTWKRLSGPMIVDKEWIARLPKIEGPLPIAMDGDRIVLAFSTG